MAGLQYTAQSALGSFTANSHVLSVTVPAGLTNAVLLIFKDCNNDLPWTTFTGITVNGTSAGVVAVGDSGSGLANRSIRVWRVNAPTAGTYNISVDFSTSSANGGLLLAAVFDDVSQTTPIADFQATSTGSTATPISRSVTTPAGGYTLAHARALSGSALTPTGAAALIGSASGESAVSVLQNASTMGFSWSGTSPTQASIVALALTPTVTGASAVTLTGPSSGTVGVASSNFTVGANGTITGTVTVTPNDSGDGGTFTPTSVAISSGTPTATFTYTAANAGAPTATINVTDNGGLTDPTGIAFTATLPAATSMTIALKQGDGTTAAASITAIHWAILNAATLGASTAVLASGTTESTDGSGNLVLDLTGLGLSVGAVRYVVTGKSNGTVGANFDGWHGPALAS